MTVELRPYQHAAIDAIRREFSRGIKRTLIVLPTGTGKTVVFSDIARRVVEKGGRVLVLAHRGELLEQALAKHTAIGVNAAIEQADRFAGDAAVVIASVQTMHPRRLATWPSDTFRLIVVDEAHHITADSYRTILDHFGGSRVLGVTATPDRLDGAGLGEIFESVAYTYELQQAIKDGYLSPIRAERVVLADVDLDGVKSRMGDFVPSDLGEAMSSEAIIHAVVAPLTKLAEERKTIVFACTVAHATALADALNVYRAGSACVVHGELDYDLRCELLAAFARGDFQYLLNCALLTEGYDEPSIACVVMCRPTKSRGLYTQCVGRGTRLAPGKTDMLVIDFVGVTKRHVLIGPKDVLGGSEVEVGETPEEREAKEEGEREVRRANIQHAVAVEFLSLHVDPFLGRVLDKKPRKHGTAPATPEQREKLKKKGLVIPPALGDADARDLWDTLVVGRAKAGLASYKQVKTIVQLRFAPPEDARELSFQEASDLLDRRLNPARRTDVDLER